MGADENRVVIVGAGAGGLAAAIACASQGLDVVLLERADGPGGKMRRVEAGGLGIDAGPTVFTMRWVFEDLLREAGHALTDAVALEQATVLARHAWTQGGTLDLFADEAASFAAIEAFAGTGEAEGFMRMMSRARDIHATLAQPFMAAEQPGGSVELMRRLGLRGLPGLARTAPMRRLWGALGDYFKEPRLRQLFARYATYVGASPLAAPATLMLVAWVEQAGVWRVQGGMRALAHGLAGVAQALGVEFRYQAEVSRIETQTGRIAAVHLADGSALRCRQLIYNGDSAALGAGLLGPDLQPYFASECKRTRSLSAVTFCAAAKVTGLPLSHHNVFFGEEYPAEFRHIFERGRIVDTPTVYVCAQNRSAAGITPANLNTCTSRRPSSVMENFGSPAQASASNPQAPSIQTPIPTPEPEPLLLLINAPADGDGQPRSPATVAALRANTLEMLARCGSHVEIVDETVTTPEGFATLFPGRGGALYGAANHGPMASFARPGPQTPVQGLYLAGGSAHPGAGVPMATLSGRLAAARLLADRQSPGQRQVRITVPEWVLTRP